MWPFGKSPISVVDATTAFHGKITAAFEEHYEAMLNIFRIAYEDDCPPDEMIYAELMPAVWALGIEPVQHIWGEELFKRVRSEMLVKINQSHTPMANMFVERFLRHTKLLRDGLTQGSATYNSDYVIKQLGLKPQPMTSIILSTQLAMLVLPYWKELEQKHQLY